MFRFRAAAIRDEARPSSKLGAASGKRRSINEHHVICLTDTLLFREILRNKLLRKPINDPYRIDRYIRIDLSSVDKARFDKCDISNCFYRRFDMILYRKTGGNLLKKVIKLSFSTKIDVNWGFSASKLRLKVSLCHYDDKEPTSQLLHTIKK